MLKMPVSQEKNAPAVVVGAFPQLISVLFSPHKDQETWDTEDPTSVSANAPLAQLQPLHTVNLGSLVPGFLMSTGVLPGVL